MLSHKQKEKLKASWGEKASCMACMAEVRVYDPLSTWECYIYALNSEDEDGIECIIRLSDKQPASLETWRLSELFLTYNVAGENVIIDHEYRPRNTEELFRVLNKGFYDFSRN